MIDSESSLPLASSFWSCWNRFSASTLSVPHFSGTGDCRYPRSMSACWISRYRSGVGSCWPRRQLGELLLRATRRVPARFDVFLGVTVFAVVRRATVFAGGVLFFGDAVFLEVVLFFEAGRFEAGCCFF